MNTSNETAVKEVIENWAKAVRNADMETILSFHTRDVLMYDVIPPFQLSGIHEFRKTWETFFQYSTGGDGSFNLTELKIKVDSKIAFATATLNVFSIIVRLTLGFVKESGRWLIAHEHHSVLSERQP